MNRKVDHNISDRSLSFSVNAEPVADQFGVALPIITGALFSAKTWDEAAENLGKHNKPGLIEALKEVISLED